MNRAPSWYSPAWPGLKNRPRTSGSPRKRRAGPEHHLQTMLVTAIRRVSPAALFYATPNGGRRDAITGARLKKEGALAGVPDLTFILTDGRAAYLELKSERGRLSTEQITFRDRALALGALWASAKTFDEAWSVLAGWNVVPPTFRSGGQQ